MHGELAFLGRYLSVLTGVEVFVVLGLDFHVARQSMTLVV